jgi:flagellar biosynthesis anti-sigma factor FlgM
VAAYGRTAEKAKKIDPPDRNKTPVEENVELSSSSKNLQKVKEKVQEMPDIRIPLVEEIRERIKNNDYPISLRAEEALETMLKRGII